MKVNSQRLFEIARQEQFAIPATNFIDLESARSYVATAERLNFPLILAFAESHKDILSLDEAAIIGNYFADIATVPVVLHLDHGASKDFIFKAIDLGFSSVMIDASSESFEDNIALTKEIVDYAHPLRISVEAELGHVGSNDAESETGISDNVHTEAKDVIEFVKRTNVDSLAISIGTAHGLYKGEPKINFERLQEIKELCSVPLVLHGGSSSGDANLNECVKNGIAKINIYTDFITAAFNKITSEDPKNYVEMKKMSEGAFSEVLEHYYKVFNTQSVEI